MDKLDEFRQEFNRISNQWLPEIYNTPDLKQIYIIENLMDPSKVPPYIKGQLNLYKRRNCDTLREFLIYKYKKISANTEEKYADYIEWLNKNIIGIIPELKDYHEYCLWLRSNFPELKCRSRKDFEMDIKNL